MSSNIHYVCVYCASSGKCDGFYLEEAARLGRMLAREGMSIVYGGGSTGLMGTVADAALEEGGRVSGVLPHFMDELEWGHRGLSELHLVDTMHQRKALMMDLADAFVALPGGCGTLEELLETITMKRLAFHTKPIVVVNLKGFYDPLIELMDRTIQERFMRERHGDMWSVVDTVDEVMAGVRSAPVWDEGAREFATL